MNGIKGFKNDFQPSLLLPAITAGVLAAIITISTEISLAALIWSGPLSKFLANGIGLMLFGSFILGIVVAFTTSLPGLLALPQDTPAAVLALIAGAIAVAMQAAAPQSIYVTVVAAIVVTSLLLALTFMLLGWFKASGFVRYIPYPVIGGFLAGTGFLLARGGVSVMVGMTLHIANLAQLFTPEKLFEWVPGVIFAVTLLLVLRRFKHFLITPAALALATALFYGYLFLAHISIADALSRGWLLGPFPAGGLYMPLTPADLAQVNWAVIFSQADKIATVLVLSVVALLLNASALEIVFQRDIDMNHELRTAGFANLAGALGSSPGGYQALGISTLAHRLGANTRLVSVICGLLCGAAVFFGATLISYFPKVVLGGMLLYLGLAFLVE